MFLKRALSLVVKDFNFKDRTDEAQNIIIADFIIYIYIYMRRSLTRTHATCGSHLFSHHNCP